MPRVAFLIPASPNAAFFSQIAVFARSVAAAPWTHWEPRVCAWFGGPIDIMAWAHWAPALADVTCTFLPDALFATDGYFAQGEARFIQAPRDVDIVAMMDADTLVAGDLEPMLDMLMHAQAVGGVMAHYPFPSHAGGSRARWEHAAAGLVDPVRLTFDQSYSLVAADASNDERLSPFYVNFGAIFLPQRVVSIILSDLLSFRSHLSDRLLNPYFAGQVAFSLALANHDVPVRALPMAFNFPNDAIAATLHADALADARILHYLRTDGFDRHTVFTSGECYAQFLSARLNPVDAVFRSHFRRIVGENLPFAALV